MRLMAQWLVVMSPLGRRASALGECRLLVGGGSMGFWYDVVACGRLIIWVIGLGKCESKGFCIIFVVSCIRSVFLIGLVLVFYLYFYNV